MPEQHTNRHHPPNPSEIVRGVRRWFLLRHRWFRHLKRWQRWTIRLAVGVPLLLLVTVLVLTRSPLTRAIVIPRLESACNLSIDADSVRVCADGRLIMDGVSCRVPGVPGPAGLVLQVERLSADVDWASCLWGSAHVREVDLTGPVIRISQSLADRSLNIAGIEPPPAPAGAGSGGAMLLPRVITHDGAIELGEHTPDRYMVLKRLPVEGLLTPAPRGEAGYVVGLTEYRRERGGGMKPGFQIHGRINNDAVALEMEDFSLDDWPPDAIPSPTRQLFTDLGLSGTVSRLAFGYSDEAGMSAELALDGVEINLPIEPVEGAPAARPAGERFMRMHGVKGTATFRQDSVLVRAEGVLEDLPYKVVLHYEGTSADSPFTCEIVSEGFHVERYPKLLPYAPPLVAKRLATFSGPTATLNTRLLLRRGEPTEAGPGPITFRGQMDFSNGTAAFDKFPYPFEGLSGTAYFDNDKVQVRNVRGLSPTGATLVARADVAPTNEDAQIDVWVEVTDAPIDEAMEEAFGPGRDRVMHALFNREKHDRLLDAGLVLSPHRAGVLRRQLDEARAELEGPGAPGDAGEVQRRIAELEAALVRPVFEFGGIADVSVHVHRPLGDKVEWSSNIEVRIQEAGLVPEAFPRPVRARGVTCRIVERDAVVSGGTYEGLTGGTADVGAAFRLPPASDPGADARTEITIDLRDMPLDDLAIHALPGEDGSALKRVLRGLRVQGTTEGRVHIAPLDVLGRPAPDGRPATGFDAEFAIAGARAAPGDNPAPTDVLVTDATGTLRVTERTLGLALDARTAGDVGAGAPLRIETDATFEFKRSGAAESAPPEIRTTVRASGADLRSPVERAVRVFSEKAADQIVALRAKHDPAGTVDVVARIHVAEKATRSVRLEVTDPRTASFDWLGGRVSMDACDGKVDIECVGGVAAEFHAFGGAMTFDGRPVAERGSVRLDGWHRFAPPPENGPGPRPLPSDGGVLHVSATAAQFESPFVIAVLDKPVGRERLGAYERLTPRGEFDAELDIRGGAGGPLRVAGTIEPRSFACTLDGVELAFDRCSGWISFEGKEGTLQNLSGTAKDWSFTVDGGWKPSEGGALLDMTIAAQGSSLTPDARAVLPGALQKALKEIKLRADGPVSLSDARFTILTGVEPPKAWSRFDGTVDFESVAFEAGAVVTQAEGRLTARFERAPGGLPSYRVGVLADRLEVAGADAHNARAIIQNGSAPGEVMIPLITGECHGGRFAGRVRVAPAGDGDREYATSLQLSGVDFGLFMHDLATQPPPASETASAPSTDPPPAKPPPEPGSRGRIDAEMSLAGFAGVPETRRGRGTIRVSGDKVRVITLPGIVPLIEVSNLALPSNAALDYAEAEFYVDGGVVSFDTLSVFSRAIEITGYGTMTWPGKELDLRFTSRSARPIPILSLVVQGIRDQLVATSVRGTPKKPDVRLISMPGTRRMLGRVIGSEQTERTRRLLELERRSTLSRHGIRPARGGQGGARAIQGSISAGVMEDQ